MRARSDPAARLARALCVSANAAGLDAQVVTLRSRSWASATFVGEGVTVRLALEGDRAAWLVRLSDADLPMRGWFVADLTVTRADAAGATLEALVLEAA